MTPARLEELESAIAEQYRRFYGACRPESVALAAELLAEVKRLREALQDIRERGESCRCHERCGCGAASGDDAYDALAGWDTRP